MSAPKPPGKPEHPETVGELRKRVRKSGPGKPAETRWGAVRQVALHQGLPIALAFVAALMLFNLVIMPRFVQHGNEVEVPDVLGRPVDDAVHRLTAMGLSVRDTVERASPSVPPGHIMDQRPRAKATIKPDRGLILVVSRGLGEQRVPELAGQTLRYARLTLSQDGYRVGDVLRVSSETVARNFVVSSDPPSGEVVGPGDHVSLLVSAGPQRRIWVMPDLRGQEIELTADKLRFAGFPVVVEDRAGWGFSRQVRATEPPSGATVAEGDTIWLYGQR